MKKYKLEFLAVQETRWLGQGIFNMKGHTIYHSGKSEGKHEFGTAFIISKRLNQIVIDFRPVNERICAIRLKLKFHNMWIINVHAPTEEKAEDIKEEFYQNLENVYNSISQNDIKLIIGDFNA